MKYFESRTHGEILSRITNDVDTLQTGINQSVTQLITSTTTLIGVLVMMLSINVWMTLAALLILPVSMFIISKVMKHSQKYFQDQQKYLGEVNGQVEEIYSGHTVVKAFNKEDDVINEFEKTNEKLYSSAWRSQFFSGIMMPIMQFVGNLGYVMVALLGGFMVIKNKIEVGDVQAFFQYIRNFTQPIQQIAQVTNMLQSSAAASERVFEFLDVEEEDQMAENPVSVDQIEGNVSFEHISFGYDPSKIIVHDFNADVKAGPKVAIVGPTGAGKTTMIKLLMRFYDVNSGEICIDGHGKFNWRELLQDLGKAYHDELHIERTLTTPKHYAYLKISEGCDRKCSYCAIPIITGRHVSRPMEEILDEVKYLVARGVKEFQVIAQELTYYGVDLYKKQMLPELVERISDIPGVEWIRLHYAYPAHFPADLFRVMRERDNVCKYMDIALQHISDNMLQKMRRHVTKDETYKLIEQFREEVPGIHLRTTLMVGHPGETEADFEELKEFVRKVRFDRMGAFAYSEEEGTYAAAEYEDSIPQEVKQARLDELMSIQQGISGELSAEKVGRQMKVIIDRLEGEYYIGRTEFDSPEVDPEVLIERGDRALHIGNFYHVEIVNSDDFDLFGRII